VVNGKSASDVPAELELAAKFSFHFELTRTLPRVDRIRELLNANPYKGEPLPRQSIPQGALARCSLFIFVKYFGHQQSAFVSLSNLS
jgi:hypothetical protein